MESKLRELFGHNMEETGREGGEIDFSQFLDSFEKSQLNTVSATHHIVSTLSDFVYSNELM
jgi:hypothetical protein